MKNQIRHLTNYFPNVSFGSGVQVCGIRNVSIGRKSCVGDDAWLNVCVRDEEVRMKIGVCVLIGRRSMVSTGGHLEIGDYSLLGPNVYVGDVDHDYRHNISVPLVCGGIIDNRCVIVEENCWLATNSVVSGHLTVGRGSVIGANAVVMQDVPPFSVVIGNPAYVIKMYDPALKKWIRIRTEGERKKILRNREKNPLPSRVEYRKILRRFKGINRIDPIVAGKEQHIY